MAPAPIQTRGYSLLALAISALALFACNVNPRGLNDRARAVAPGGGEGGAAGAPGDMAAPAAGGRTGAADGPGDGPSRDGAAAGPAIEAGGTAADSAADLVIASDASSPPVVGPPDAPPAVPLDGPPPAPRDSAAPLQALLLVGAEEDLRPGDAAVEARLQSLGFRVTVKGVANQQEANAAATVAASHHLVVLVSSLEEGTGLPRMLRELPVPIVCSKRLFFQNLGMSAGADNNGVSQTALITIVDSAHPLAGGRNGLFNALNRIAQIGWGRPVPSAMRVATVPGEPERTVIFAIEKGAPAPFGPAPARRVGWFALDFSALNPGGWTLFDAAIKWAQGAP